MLNLEVAPRAFALKWPPLASEEARAEINRWKGQASTRQGGRPIEAPVSWLEQGQARA